MYTDTKINIQTHTHNSKINRFIVLLESKMQAANKVVIFTYWIGLLSIDW